MATLIVDGERFALKKTSWHKMWQFGNEDFYVFEQCLRQTQGPRTGTFASLLPDTTEFVPSAPDDRFVVAEYKAWLAGAHILYRGFSTQHKKWDDLQAEWMMYSEGIGDSPSFTDCKPSEGGTRWLPATTLPVMAQGLARGTNDAFTQPLSLHDPIALGLVAEVVTGKSRGIGVCFLNGGESVIRGPLRPGQYRMHQIVWMDNLGPAATNWPAGLERTTLPPRRPWQPALEETVTTWIDCAKPWVQAVAALDRNVGRMVSEGENRRGFANLPGL
jgi:hypothetical protein